MQKTTLKILTKLFNVALLFLLLQTATQICNAQTKKDSIKIRELKNPSIEDYEQLVFESTQYLLSNPVDKKSAKFVSASKIVCFWMHQETGYGMPLGGNFYYKLRNESNQQYIYAVSMVNYLLDQKINHKRVLKCLPIAGQNYSMQEDVQEVRLKAAEIFLDFAKKRKNKIKLTVRARKYLKHHRKGTLHEKFLEDIEEPPKLKEINSPFITYVRPN
ncbi:hypothetical protein UMM65_06340 [Aureibaculum sp. 2210JD6-5]|uniref:hypothetical protein n=1 Tax=Aureibaculum sp. 2210JD6-5 TaxID=3103957 RepID=UPI002AAE8E9A|nr:hypothetical protein [Aureibaculum sp. 2210JD6-5]MDY7394853.1 hypothetical protein [Aureibaculum sp. 2210JD6-5]